MASNTRSRHSQSDANEAVTEAIADARLRLERSSGRYAHDLRELAAHLISAHLPSARTALLSKGHKSITFDTVIALVAVRDAPRHPALVRRVQRLPPPSRCLCVGRRARLAPRAQGDRELSHRGVLGPARSLVVQRDGHAEHASSISGEDSVTLLLDGHLVIGVDLDGLGLWCGDEEWEQLHLDGTLTERYIRVDLTEDEFHGLSRLLSIHQS